MSQTSSRVPLPAGRPYRGRLAPSPTGWLHLGHARTFWTAQERCRAAAGVLLLRSEDLDRGRCKPEFAHGMIEDLRWFGFAWDEGPDVGGPFAPYSQRERLPQYRAAFHQLVAGGWVYGCTCSRKDVQAALRAPHAVDDDEPLYPGTCRAEAGGWELDSGRPQSNWRFRVPDGETITFRDGHLGDQTYVAGRDFGDFLIWRSDDLPAYQLACVVDDAAMRISEVVRGADLLKSTARQLLLYRALGLSAPDFCHCPLMTDEAGIRLAKRHDALSLRALREHGRTATELRRGW